MIDINSSPRELALGVLNEYVREKSFIDLALKGVFGRSNLDIRDKTLAARICYGVVQNRLLLDYYISSLSSVRLKKMHPVVLDILRMGFYQLLFMDKIPASAAVNTAVELTKKSPNKSASGFVNAIMRRAAREELSPPEGEDAGALSIRFSHPEWLVELFLEKIGPAETIRLLEINNTPAPTCARLNRLKGDMQSLKNSLSNSGAVFEPHPALEDCLYLFETGDIEKLPAFSAGLFTVQDAASQICVLATGAKRGEIVLDACAAPGGKSFYLAELMENSGELFSCDIYDHKIKLIESGAKRLGVSNIKAQRQDAGEFNPEWKEKFDLVLADLPCSGLGIIRKKPDIRYKAQEDMKTLPELQEKLLSNLSGYVKPGGTLVYSTCTLNFEENEGVAAYFLMANPDFSPEDFSVAGKYQSEGGMLTLWPQIHATDGFFICKMRKKPT